MTVPRSSTSPSAATAPPVRSSGNAPPAWSAGSRATSIRMPATMPRRSCRPRPIGSHAPHGRRSKPCLARPSIISRWCASDCAASAAPGTSSCSPPRSRISNAWQCTPQGGRHSPRKRSQCPETRLNLLDRPPIASADRLRRPNTVQPVQSRTQIPRPTRLPQQPQPCVDGSPWARVA